MTRTCGAGFVRFVRGRGLQHRDVLSQSLSRLTPAADRDRAAVYGNAFVLRVGADLLCCYLHVRLRSGQSPAAWDGSRPWEERS
jgi:hypothetical protein